MMNNNFNNGTANNNNNELNGGKMIMVNGRVENLVAFGEVVKGAIEELCTDCMVSVNEVTKNNGLTLTGITIKSKDSNLAPTIYLNDMYKEYLAGASLGEIVNRVIKVYQENRVHNDFDVSAITDFDRVKSRICFKLVNAERNVALLKTVPYVEFHDLAVVFYILLSCDAGGNATVTVKNEMLDIWSINEIDDLYELAKRNTTRLMRATVNSMFEVVMGIVADHPDSIDKDIVDSLFDMNVYPYEQKDVQEIYDLIVETVVGKGGSMTISGQQYPRELVKSRFLKLNMSHVEYVMECLRKNTTKVYNIKAYLLAALFNAGTTMSNYYRAEVNHDMPQFAG